MEEYNTNEMKAFRILSVVLYADFTSERPLFSRMRTRAGRAISLLNAPRRSPARPQTHGGNTVGSRSAQGDRPSVGAVIGPSVGIYGSPTFHVRLDGELFSLRNAA